VAASSYGWKVEDDDLTQPTGFDPEAARPKASFIDMDTHHSSHLSRPRRHQMR
jgi:hypothetical protein